MHLICIHLFSLLSGAIISRECYNATFRQITCTDEKNGTIQTCSAGGLCSLFLDHSVDNFMLQDILQI